MSDKDLVNNNVDSDDDDDDDDDDYCPTKNPNEQSDPSDESERDDGDDDEGVDESTAGQNQQIGTKKQTDLDVKPYDESKTDELWKNFMSSSNGSTTKKDIPKTTTEKPTIQDSKPVIKTKVFEFAGEKIVVPVTTSAAATTTTAATSKESPSLKRPTTSATSVLDRLGIAKKQKLSTLEKSRLDWSVHKQSESLIEDLDSHRRGKDSYVEKKAFLQRTELREHDHYLSNVKKR